jgi:hypothetical protein
MRRHGGRRGNREPRIAALRRLLRDSDQNDETSLRRSGRHRAMLAAPRIDSLPVEVVFVTLLLAVAAVIAALAGLTVVRLFRSAA